MLQNLFTLSLGNNHCIFVSLWLWTLVVWLQSETRTQEVEIIFSPYRILDGRMHLYEVKFILDLKDENRLEKGPWTVHFQMKNIGIGNYVCLVPMIDTKNGIKPDVSQGFKIIFQYSAFVMLYSHRMKLTLYKKRASMLVAILLRNING